MLTKLRRGGLLGKQQPRVKSLPTGPRDYSEGDDALAVADIAGRECMDWQSWAIRESMATRPDSDKWVAFEVAWLVARQNGKNGGIEVVELGWMVNEPGISILHTAHEFQTALESMDKLEALIRSHPMLESEIASIRYGNGKESIRLRNGSIIRFRTRTKSGGRGFSVDRLVIDEAMIWSPASQAAIMPLLTTAQRPQIWYLGSAADVDTHEYCGKWASLRQRALAGGDDGLIWLEWSAPEPPKDPVERATWRQDRENWSYANPGMGELLTEEYIEAEMRAFRSDLDKWEVERLSVGRWPALTAIDSEIPAQEWADMRANGAPTLINAPAIGLHREGGVWTITAAQHSTTGAAHLEVGYSRAASSTEVVAAVVELVAAWNPCAVAIKNRSDAAAIKAELIKAGVEPEMIDGSVWSQWCGGFLNAALGAKLSHSGQSELDDAASAAVKREMPAGGFVWDEAAAGTAAGALCSATLAHGALLAFGKVAKGRTVAPRTGAIRRRTTPDAPNLRSTSRNGRQKTDLNVMSARF